MKTVLTIMATIVAITSTSTLLAKRNMDDEGTHLAYNSEVGGGIPADGYQPAYVPTVYEQRRAVTYNTEQMVIDARIKAEKIRMEAAMEAKKARMLAELEIEKSRMEVELYKKRLQMMGDLTRKEVAQQYDNSKYQKWQYPNEQYQQFRPKQEVVRGRDIASEKAPAKYNERGDKYNFKYKGWKKTDWKYQQKEEEIPYGFDFHPGGY